MQPSRDDAESPRDQVVPSSLTLANWGRGLRAQQPCDAGALPCTRLPRKSGPKSSLHGWAQSGETQGTCAEFSRDGGLVPGDVKGSHSEPEKSQACQGTASGPHQEKPRAGRKLGRHSAL